MSYYHGRHRQIDMFPDDCEVVDIRLDVLPQIMASAEWMGMSILMFPQDGMPNLMRMCRQAGWQSL